MYWFGKFTLNFFEKVAAFPNRGVPPMSWDDVFVVAALGLAGAVGFCYIAGLFVIFGRAKFTR